VSDYTHDDAMRDLDWLAPPKGEHAERWVRNNIAAYIERLEAERDSERRWANQYSAERNEWEAVALEVARMLEDEHTGWLVYDAIAAAQEAVRHE